MAIVKDRFGIRSTGERVPGIPFVDDYMPTVEEICNTAQRIVDAVERDQRMHYRNGREAKNGDKIVQLGTVYSADGQPVPTITALGVLYDAKPGNDYCNGSIAPVQQAITGACMCDCLHVDDLAAILNEKGLDKRPVGK